jgi:hypothetical protein
VRVNAAPRGGNATVSPQQGTCLSTLFRVSSRGWRDPEGDLPLSYTVLAAGRGAPRVTLAEGAVTTVTEVSVLGCSMDLAAPRLT